MSYRIHWWTDIHRNAGANVLLVLTWGPILDDLRNGRLATGPH